MNKDLLIHIKASDKERVQGLLQRADRKAIRHEADKDSVIFSGFNGFKCPESDLMLFAEGFRQILLSRVPGCVITRIRMKYGRESGKEKAPSVPVLHKYAYIPGVVENVREITGNLQKGVFRLPGNENILTLNCEFSIDIPVSSHYKEFLLGEFFDEDQADVIINPEQKVLTFQDTGHHVYIEFKIERGVGFKKSEVVKRDEMAEIRGNPDVLNLALDANFNPVTRVGYTIHKKTLQFEIETNGAISPLEAYKIAYALFSKELMQSEGS